MSRPWWTEEAAMDAMAVMVEGLYASQKQPQLHPPGRQTIINEIRDHISAFTPEWSNLIANDAGVALVKLFGEQAEPIVKRLNQLPEKAYVEFLRLAGIQPIPARPAKALLRFEISDAAPNSVLIGRGFQIGAQPVDGADELVVFETESNLHATSATIAEAYTEANGLFHELDVSGESGGDFQPFGNSPQPGNALWLGLSSSSAPSPTLTIGVKVAALSGTPPPASAGGVSPLPVEAAPLLRWEVFHQGRFQPVEIINDDTRDLQQAGILEIKTPRQWLAARPKKLEGDDALYWLRLRVVFGNYEKSPTLSFIHLNMVAVIAAHTVRNEVLEHVAGGQGRIMRISQAPVVEGTLQLEIDDGVIDADPFTSGGSQNSENTTQWQQVQDLSTAGPDDRVYTLNNSTGEVTFGDGVNGAAVPSGFRNVRAISYQVASGAASAVEADQITSLINSTPFVIGASNPDAASGGTDEASYQQTLRRGPQQIRARGRAVTTADFALLALQASGAEVQRAHAVSGFHPVYPGAPIPGIVTVFVVSGDATEVPPVANNSTLAAVANHLSQNVAPAGVEVVAAVPRYHSVKVEMQVELDPNADVSTTTQKILDELDRYFNPIRGSEDGEGWPFGGVIRHSALVRRVLAQVTDVRAIPFLNLVVDGIRQNACHDSTISAYGLLWPAGHQIIPLNAENNV